jgi:hypothetical protein
MIKGMFVKRSRKVEENNVFLLPIIFNLEKEIVIFLDPPDVASSSFLLLHCADLLVLGLELVGKGKLGRLLLKLGKLVLKLGDLLERGLHELALHVRDGHGELVDGEVAQQHLALQVEHVALQVEPLRMNETE